MPKCGIHTVVAVGVLVTVGLAAASGAASAPAVGSRLASSSGQAAAKIAVISHRGGGPVANSTVYVMNADGSGTRRLATKVWPSVPAWSPDGRKLVFVRRLPAFVGGNIEPRLSGASSARPRRVRASSLSADHRIRARALRTLPG
jgi:dipeptidyl aminopeptidase/acylaminoacyl peptidase